MDTSDERTPPSEQSTGWTQDADREIRAIIAERGEEIRSSATALEKFLTVSCAGGIAISLASLNWLLVWNVSILPMVLAAILFAGGLVQIAMRRISIILGHADGLERALRLVREFSNKPFGPEILANTLRTQPQELAIRTLGYMGNLQRVFITFLLASVTAAVGMVIALWRADLLLS